MNLIGKMLLRRGDFSESAEKSLFRLLTSQFLIWLVLSFIFQKHLPMKRLVVCSDGTWMQRNVGYPSNVQKICEAIKTQASDGTLQAVKYDAGVGTAGGIDTWVGGAFGWGIDRNIQELYEFLAEHYESEDEVYLFGYSRGAYTVRSLAGMIYCCGLLPKKNIAKISSAYALYRNRKITPNDPEAKTFRQQNDSPQIDITLIGCWDTVGALGIPQIIPWLPINDLVNKKYRFHDTKLNRKIQAGLHAMSIDERRRAFDVNHMDLSDNANTSIKEVWFPGTHGSVGGGRQETAGLSDGALLWMVEEVANLGIGLEFDLEQVKEKIKPDHTTAFSNALGLYKFTGAIDRDITGEVEGLHLSVKQRWQERALDYRPIKLAQRFGDYLDRQK